MKPYAALLGATACWGAATAVAKYAVGDLGAFTTLAVESGVAAAVLAVLAVLRRTPRTLPLRRYALLGLVEPGITYGGLDLGLRFTSAGSAALLDGLTPCFVLLLGVALLGQRIRPRAGLGAAIATAGVLVLSAWHSSPRLGLGAALVLTGVLGGALAVILVNRMSAGGASAPGTLELTTWQFAFGFGWSALFAAVAAGTGAEQLPGPGDGRPLAGAAALGIGAFVVAYLLYNYAVARVPVAVSGMALTLVPVFGVTAAALLLGEGLGAPQLAGGVLILAGLLVFPYGPAPERRPAARPEHPPGPHALPRFRRGA
jgi:drug/metabolite transporter (DMT)-like permease